MTTCLLGGWKLTVVWRSSLIGLVIFWAGEIAAQEYHIKGEVEYRLYSQNYTREFEFIVKGKAWQVVSSRKLPDRIFPGARTLLDGRVIEPPSVPGRKPGDKIAEDRSDVTMMGGVSLEEHFDFQTTAEYFLGAPGRETPGQPAQPPIPAGRQLNQMLRIYPGPVPWESREKTLPFLWLAFGSGPYFANLKTNMVVPFYHQWAQRWGFRGYQQEARWRLAETVPRLPLVVSYINPGQKLERPYTNGVYAKTLVFVPYSPPYDKGFTNGHYVVLASTNIGGLTLPTEFKFEEYDLAGSGAGRPIRTVHGKVHSLASYCPKKDLKFKFPGNVTVIDERVRTNPDMSRLPSYKSTRWLTTNEVFALLEEKKNPSVQTLAMAAKPKPHPWWQGPVAVGALLVPGGVVWWRLRRAKAAKPGGAA